MKTMPDIRFSGDFPEQYVLSVTRCLRRWLPDMAPHYNSLYVLWGEADGHKAQVIVQDEYRTATIVIASGWGEYDEKERRELIVHELSHMNQGPALSAIQSVVDEFVPENCRGYAAKELTRAIEAANEDMARACLRLAARLDACKGTPGK